MATRTSAPGKIILLGEHAAVYGNPVLVATVDKRAVVSVEKRDDDNILFNSPQLGVKALLSLPKLPDLKKRREFSLVLEAISKVNSKFNLRHGWSIEVNSEIPVSSGMGSSASIASALVLGMSLELGENLGNKEIANLAWEIEHIIHGKSSGVDPFAVTFGGVLLYKKGDFKRIPLKKYPRITIGNTGIISDTGKLVSQVAKLKENYPEFFSYYLQQMRKIIEYGQKFLEEGKLEKFGEIMNINHGLLSSIGVSSPELEKLVWAARKKSPGAKLCGAGAGGIMIALGDVAKEIEQAGGKVIKTKISGEGVRVEG